MRCNQNDVYKQCKKKNFRFLHFWLWVFLSSTMRASGRSSRRSSRRDWHSTRGKRSLDDVVIDLDDPTVKLWARLAVYALVFIAPGYVVFFPFFPGTNRNF